MRHHQREPQGNNVVRLLKMFLLGAACACLVVWGMSVIRTASHSRSAADTRAAAMAAPKKIIGKVSAADSPVGELQRATPSPSATPSYTQLPPIPDSAVCKPLPTAC
jgi:hypothetical protein